MNTRAIIGQLINETNSEKRNKKRLSFILEQGDDLPAFFEVHVHACVVYLELCVSAGGL